MAALIAPLKNTGTGRLYRVACANQEQPAASLPKG